MDILRLLAFVTFIIQGFLFPLLILYTLYFVYKNLFAKSKSRPKNSDLKKAVAAPEPAQRLHPLSCAACGGQVMPVNGKRSCGHCGKEVPIPNEYQHLFLLREEATQRLNRAARYWKRANRLTSPWMRWFLLLLALWLFATFFILLTASSERKITGYEEVVQKLGAVGDWFMGLGVVSIFFWIFILFITRGILSPKIRRHLPVPESDMKLAGQAEDTSCGTCGGPLHFNAGDLGCVCVYCGTETYRVKLASQLHSRISEGRGRAGASLIEAMQVYEAALDDAIGTPVMLVFILILLPFFFIALPAILWDVITEYPFISAGAVALLVVILVLLFRKRKAQLPPK